MFALISILPEKKGIFYEFVYTEFSVGYTPQERFTFNLEVKEQQVTEI